MCQPGLAWRKSALICLTRGLALTRKPLLDCTKEVTISKPSHLLERIDSETEENGVEIVRQAAVELQVRPLLILT